MEISKEDFLVILNALNLAAEYTRSIHDDKAKSDVFISLSDKYLRIYEEENK